MFCPSRRSSEVPRTIGTPSGTCMHVRVQVREGAEDYWRMHASFRSLSQAQACLADLQARQIHARLIRYDRCPAPV